MLNACSRAVSKCVPSIGQTILLRCFRTIGVNVFNPRDILYLYFESKFFVGRVFEIVCNIIDRQNNACNRFDSWYCQQNHIENYDPNTNFFIIFFFFYFQPTLYINSRSHSSSININGKLIMSTVCFTVSYTLEVAARVHSEWDARLLRESIYTYQQFPPSIETIRNGLNADQVTVPIGQKPIVWHSTAEVSQLSANTNVQRQWPI